MIPRIAIIFTIFISLLGTLCQQAPAYSKQYELGIVHSFSYDSSVLLSDKAGPEGPPEKKVGFRVGLTVDISALWQNPSDGGEQIIQLKVNSPQLSVKSRQSYSAHSSKPSDQFTQRPSKIGHLSNYPLYFVRKHGLIRSVFHSSKETTSSLNIKKGIVNLLQYQNSDGTREETQTSGKCWASYKVKDRMFLEKTNYNCSKPDHLPFFSHSEEVLSADLSHDFGVSYELDPTEGSVVSCSTSEILVMRIKARKNSLVEVFSGQTLRLLEKGASKSRVFEASTIDETIGKISSLSGSSLVKGDLVAQEEVRQCIACKTLKDIVNNFRKSLSSSNLGTQSSSIAFLRLLRKMRESSKNDIESALKDKKNSKILPQLLDIAAAAQTIPAYEASKLSFDFLKEDVELSERFLMAVSLSTNPKQFVIEDLLKLSRHPIKDVKLWETLLLSLASITKTFSSHSKNDRKIIEEVTQRIVGGLNACEVDHCALVHIRGLKNLQNPETLPILLALAKGANKKRAIYAMRVLQTMPQHYINNEVEKTLEKILLELDARHDSSVRAMAAEILLRWKPKVSLLKSIFQLLSSTPDKGVQEFKTLLWSHIRDLCEKDHRMNDLVREEIFKNNLVNWNTLSLGGLSSAFSRHFTTTTTDSLSSNNSFSAFFTNMLEINGGLLKRSNVDVFVDIPGGSRMRLLSFGMFAGGLSMFSSDNTESETATEGETEDANAGIEISLMGTQLRPYVFFTGQGELMGHVWSGTASERTTALQGSALLHDHKQVLFLQNGLTVEFLLTGSISFDFAGQVQISLWNRDAHSLVEVGSAVVVQGQARVDTSFVQTMVEFNTGAQTQLDFISDLDFSDDIAMCLQMVQPNFNLTDTVRKFERIPGNNYVLRKYKKRSTVVPGKTFVMNKKNTELCSKMFRT